MLLISCFASVRLLLGLFFYHIKFGLRILSYRLDLYAEKLASSRQHHKVLVILIQSII